MAVAGKISQLLGEAATATIDGVYGLHRKLIVTGKTDGAFGRAPIDALFTPKKLAQEFAENSESVSIKGKMTATDPFETWSQERLSTLDSFATLKGADGKLSPFAATLSTKLNGATNQINQVKTDIQDALALDPPTTTAHTDFSKNIAAINAIINDNNNFNIAAMAGYLQELKAGARSSIVTQHQEQTNRLTATLNDPGFQEALKTGLNMNDAAVGQFKQDMLDALKTSQDKELQKLETSINGEVTKLHQLNAQEIIRVEFLATMWKESTAMRNNMMALAAKNAQRNGNAAPMQVDYDAMTGSAKFKDLDVRDIEAIETITGSKITIVKGANAAGDTFTLEMPKYGFLYYRSNKIDMDLLSLAMAVRACGHQGIIMSIDLKDEERARMIGRKQYEACVAAGFDPNGKAPAGINIMVNGKKIEPGELFKDQPNKYQSITQKYASDLAKAKQMAPKVTPLATQQMKDLVQAKRQAIDNPPQNTPNTPAP